MIKILNIQQTRQAEAAADAAGYSYSQMMQAAGRAVAERALTLLQDRAEPKITVMVGAGNNGGDGLVAGQLIAQARPDAQVRFYLLTARDAETDLVFKPVQEAGLFIAQFENDFDGRVCKHMVASADLVIDALFGIGVRLPFKGDAAKLLRYARQALNERARARRDEIVNNPTLSRQVKRAPKTYVLAVDCPSGVHCDTGEADSLTLQADETITFIAAKPGLLTFPAAGLVGDLYVASLELPEEIELAPLKKSKHTLLDHEAAANLLPARPLDGHKNTFGKVMVIGGSANYLGAPGLSGAAAYRSGAGLVTIAAPGHVINSLAAQFLEATWLYLPSDMGAITADAARTLADEIGTYKAAVIGMGMGTDVKTRDFLRQLFTFERVSHKRQIGFSAHEEAPAEQTMVALPPLVIDADALNLLAEMDSWWSLLPANTILTPHPGEMARLCGITGDKLKAQDRLHLAIEKAQAWNAVIVLKGAHTVIAAPDGRAAISPFKTTALATAGTGDVLAGLIAGWVAQGLDAFEAAQLGVYVQGYAGVTAASFYGYNEASVTARDVLEALPYAINDISVV